MVFLGKYKILITPITACDYGFILNDIRNSYKKNKALLISPLASQTLIKAYFDKDLQKILDKFNYLLPDSQWVRHSLHFLYGKALKNRVYGPELMLRICKLSSEQKYKIFLFGPSKKTVDTLKKRLKVLYPGIIIVGTQAAKFPPFTQQYKKNLIEKIISKNADIFFMALSSPLEQVLCFDLYSKIKLRKKFFVAIPVGAAFDFNAGVKKQAPLWMQNSGFEWLFRLVNEPKRLWFRYLVLGPVFVLLILLQKLNLLNLTDNITIKNKT